VLGWHAFDDLGSEDLSEFRRFYDAHWRFFETRDRRIEYPGFPIQGQWRVDAVGLSDQVLEKVYIRNVQGLIASRAQ
jgi:hypothetical protein